MISRLDLKPDHAKIVADILAGLLPPGAIVLVFGSRARGRAKPFSDLDLAVKAATPLSLSLLGDFADAFSESDLPFKVDVVDWLTAPPYMKAAIEADGIALFPTTDAAVSQAP